VRCNLPIREPFCGTDSIAGNPSTAAGDGPRHPGDSFAVLETQPICKGEIAMSDLMNRLVRTATAGGLAAVLFVAAPAFAAPENAMQGGAPLRLAQGAQRQAQPPKQAAQPATNPIEQQINDLRRRLNITQAQQAQFDAFAQAMRQNSQTMDGLAQQEQQKPSRTAVEDLQSTIKLSEAEVEGLKRLLPPLQALYDSLSDQQKRTADQVLANSPQQAPPQQQPQGKRR
jgi:hypothetical protein